MHAFTGSEVYKSTLTEERAKVVAAVFRVRAHPETIARLGGG